MYIYIYVYTYICLVGAGAGHRSDEPGDGAPLYYIISKYIILFYPILSLFFRRANHSTNPSTLPYYGPIWPLPHNVSMAWLWPTRGPPALAPLTHATNPATGRKKGSESHPTDNEQNEQKQSEHELCVFSSRLAWDQPRSRLFSGVNNTPLNTISETPQG